MKQYESFRIYPKPIRIFTLVMIGIIGIFLSVQMIFSDITKYQVGGYITLIGCGVFVLTVIFIGTISFILKKPTILIENGLWTECHLFKDVSFYMNDIQEFVIEKENNCKFLVIRFLDPFTPPHKTPISNFLFGDLDRLCNQLQSFLD